jgi:hypothetical protein
MYLRRDSDYILFSAFVFLCKAIALFGHEYQSWNIVVELQTSGVIPTTHSPVTLTHSLSPGAFRFLLQGARNLNMRIISSTRDNKSVIGKHLTYVLSIVSR